MLPLLKEKLVLWANGGPQQLEEAVVGELNLGTTSCSDDDDVELEGDEAEHFEITGEQFNLKLIEMDSVTKKLAEMFPRDFGGAYLTSLVHSNAQRDFVYDISTVPAEENACLKSFMCAF